MPEDPTPPSEPTPQPSEAEWTDNDIDSIASASEASTASEDETSVSTDEATSEEAWEDDALDWKEEPIDLPEPQPKATSTREALAWLGPVWRRVVVSWRRILAGIRTRIPAAAKLPDAVLSGVLIGGLVLLLTVFNNVRQPSSVVVEAPPAIAPSVEEEPLLEPPLADASPSTETPSAPPDSPELELDPAERDRIAELQTQLTTGSLSNGNGVVESVQADFKHNQLTINLTNGWYRLSGYEQEELANTFKQRSVAMTFDDVELRSPNGDLVARSPVVGNNMIILQREQPPIVDPPPKPRYRITVDR